MAVDLQWPARVEGIDGRDRVVLAIGNFTDGASHSSVSQVDDPAGQTLQIRHPIFGQQVGNTGRHLLAGPDHGVKIAADLVRGAHVLANDRPQGLVALPGVIKLQDRYLQAFFVDIPAVRRPPPAADVPHMGNGPGEANQLAGMKDRCRQSNVRQVSRPDPGVVTDHNIAWPQGFGRVLLQERLDRYGQGADKRRDAAGRLGDRSAVGRQHHAGVIVRFAYHGGKGCSMQSQGSLVNGRDKPGP